MDRGNTLTGNQYVVQVSVCGRRPLFNFEIIRDDSRRPVFFSLVEGEIVFSAVLAYSVFPFHVPAFEPRHLAAHNSSPPFF